MKPEPLKGKIVYAPEVNTEKGFEVCLIKDVAAAVECILTVKKLLCKIEEGK
jgi:hypothetical protein